MKISTTCLTVIFISCFSCSRPTKNSSEETVRESPARKDTVIQEILKPVKDVDLVRGKVKLHVKDSTEYSSRFLSKLLEGLGPGRKYELKSDTIITDDKYVNNFRQVLPDNKEVILKGEKKGNKYLLKLRQVKHTTISYDFEFVDNKGNKIKESGLADLSPSFMLAAEGDNDDDGGGFWCSEYWTYKHDCLFSIRIGPKDNMIKGKVTGCNDNLDLDNCPTLK